MTVHLKDIAAYTGVSIKTVSNVINGNYARVGPETRAMVLAAIEKLNYQPNIAARQLRKARVGVLAYAIPDIRNPYFTEVGDIMTRVAEEHKYTLLLDYTYGPRDPEPEGKIRYNDYAYGSLEKELSVIKGLRPHLIDGVILDPQALTIDDIKMEEVKGPLVLVGERLFGAPFDHVLIDNVQAAYQATNHLLAIGKRRIAVIGSQETQSQAPSLRTQGYSRALREAGIEVDESLLISGGYWHRSDGANAMRYLLSLENPPDAVFCFNDLMAMGALSVINAAGLSIPDDIAVMGFDNVEEGQYAYPPLSTVSPDKEEISRLAVTSLIGRIQGTRTQEPERILVPFELCIRASTMRNRANVQTPI
ncbi:LacI family DNA-binding transcriptional regulator [Dictyobacter aurantiacus]|uniref:LacI family transcriptional regulator n=1 Tax=Dictyobacter aurantiacus TaxID=1936993 RepID=A0A401ZGI7_9CHLR|nr:LacI family DNA-binding transcriptional regulator [Dictyobacter aurantiacus]GCE05977.1 LacI family transcriptional regulator [Dictyobacter aurantiacus]